MKWFWKKQEPDRTAVDASAEQLEVARSRRRAALQRLVKVLDEVRIDDGLVKVGDDMLRPGKRYE